MPLPLMKPRRLPISCLILNLLCVCLAGRVAAAVFDRPSGTDSNTVYAIAASIGGPTNGITAATVTNIAAYQALIATNDVMRAVTNTTLALDVRRFFSPQDQNLYLSNTLQRAKAGKHLRILNFGDDAFHPRDGALATISTFRRNYGGVGESPSFYADRTADVVQGTLLAGTPIRTYGMPTGSWMSNRTAILTDKITLQYWQSNAFGTLTIYTNNGGAGAYGVVAVVDGNNGTTLTAATTNFTISPATVKAYILSTGTNFINMVGQYYENIGTNFSWDIWQDGNAAIVNTMTNAFTSNSLVTFLQNFDLAIFNDATLSNQVYLGHPLLWNAVTNRAPTCDILFLHQNPVTNQFGPSYDVRQAMSSFSRDYGAPLLDTGGMLLPINPNVTSNYYLADGVHLSTAGNTLLGSRVAGIIANPYWSIPNANPAAQALASDLMWFTNATSGTITNLNGGGVSVGTSFVAITNGGAVVNLGKTAGMLRVLNNGVYTLIASNTITTGNATGTVVHASSMVTSDNEFRGRSANLTDTSTTLRLGNRVTLEAPGNGTLRVLGTITADTNIITGTVTATNGFFLPQLSGIPSVDIRSSSGNTNWLVFNLGGDLYAIKTNAAAASSYITNKLTGLDLLSSKVVLGSAVSLTTDTAANVTSLSLGSGDWMVSGNVNFINGGGTTLSGSITSIGTTSATLATDGTESYRGPGVANWNYEGVTVTPVKITGPATVYLVTKVTFSISSCSAFGSINAEQVR